MRRLLTMVLAFLLLVGCLPVSSAGAATKQMRDGVPVWDEDTVKQYALDFIQGSDFERLFNYYDLQVRRYMPMDTFTAMLTEIEWMTGGFVGFGTYDSFNEDALKTKTHVLHLCMEKQDLDLYFTHKNEEDDWEVMAVEFVPGEKQDAPTNTSDTDAAAEDSTQQKTYTETDVQVGKEPYLLGGTLTLPAGATAQNKVPGVVLVQGSGPSDRDETIGQTKLFADLAAMFAQRGIATLRYDKRTFQYGADMTAEQVQALTVEEETIQDAISAGTLLKANEYIDPQRVVLLGHSMGAMLAPRIVSEADGVFSAMMLVSGSPKSLLDIMLAQNQAILETLEGDALASAQTQVNAFAAQVDALKKAKTAEAAKQITLAGVNGYYFWEMMQTDACKLIRSLKIPTYIVQGEEDFQVTPDNGIDAYEDELGNKLKFVEFRMFRKLNHLLMLYNGPTESEGTVAEYDTPATLDTQAGRYLADWVLALGHTNEED